MQILLVHSLDKDTMLAWKNYVYFEGCSREASGKLKNARAKFANAKTAQKENAKNSMVSCLQYAHQFTVFRCMLYSQKCDLEMQCQALKIR